MPLEKSRLDYLPGFRTGLWKQDYFLFCIFNNSTAEEKEAGEKIQF